MPWGGGGLTFSPAPALGSPWLPRRVGRATRAIGPGHGTPAPLYMIGWKETPGKLDHYKNFCFLKTTTKNLKKKNKTTPFPHPSQNLKNTFFWALQESSWARARHRLKSPGHMWLQRVQWGRSCPQERSEGASAGGTSKLT